jgi:hypothetical protein
MSPDLGRAGPVCPVCGRVAWWTVIHPESVDAETRRLIRTYGHPDGTEHRVPVGPVEGRVPP